ncbi:MAG: microcin [Rouxiella aceris]|uniref:E492 group microcin n=1 Tax=Rouxiella aceris TaxID=2703884 RepID=UPI00283B5C59|nr:microcin [Rouxiella aceris]MDR3433369.1 microcin [Rouxiella aceris]
MREICRKDLIQALGAGDTNAQLIKDMGTNVVWGAVLGSPGGVAGATLGAVGSVLQTIGQGLIDHGPVNVPIPVLIGPSWNGSGGRNTGSHSSSVASESGS